MRRRQFIKVFCTRKPELKFKYESLLLNVAKIVKNLFFLLSNNRERLYLFPNIRELEKLKILILQIQKKRGGFVNFCFEERTNQSTESHLFCHFSYHNYRYSLHKRRMQTYILVTGQLTC